MKDAGRSWWRRRPEDGKALTVLTALLIGVLFLLGLSPVGAMAAPPAFPLAQPTPTLPAFRIGGPYVEPTLLSLPGEETVQARLELHGNDLACPPLPVAGPVDIFMVVDRSESMNDPAGEQGISKMEAALNAMRAFIDLVEMPRHRVGIVAFNDLAEEIAPLSDMPNALYPLLNLDHLVPNDGTAIDMGLAQALRLFELEGRPNARRVIVLLSDGQSDFQAALAAAGEATDRGIRIITVALGDDADRALLAALASDPSDAYVSPTTQELARIYENIVYTIERARAVSDVTLTLTYDPTAWEIVGVDPQPQQEQSGQLTWSFPYLQGNDQTIFLEAQPLKSGQLPFPGEGQLSYVLCEDHQATQAIASGPTVQILPPPTPTPIPTPTPFVPPPPCEHSRVWWYASPFWAYLPLLAAALWWLLRLARILWAREPCWWCDALGTAWWPLILGTLWAILQHLRGLWGYPYAWCRGLGALLQDVNQAIFPSPLIPALILAAILAVLLRYCETTCPVEERVWHREPPRPAPEPLPPITFETPWQVRPTLILGLGGTGRWVLTLLKHQLLQSGHGRLPEGIRFLAVDTAEQETINRYQDRFGREEGVRFGDTTLTANEVYLLKGDLSRLINALASPYETAEPQDPRLASFTPWFPAKDYRRLGVQVNLSHGTFSRRPMARAGLISHLQASPDLPLWQQLLTWIEEVSVQGEVEVILVGALGGGMSGTVADLAYLARKAAQVRLGTQARIHLQACLVTPEAYQGIAGNLEQQRVNAGATLRELQRFHVGGAWPYPMRYLGGGQPPDGVYQGRLFDEIFLFGGEGYFGERPDPQAKPWARVLASVADFVYLQLDAVLRARWHEWRNQVLHAKAHLETTHEDLVVSTVGTYAVRWPLYDLLTEAKARWAADFIRFWFDPGETYSGPQGEDARLFAWNFLLGDPGLALGEPPAGLTLAARITQGETIGKRALRQLTQQLSQQNLREQYRRYLATALEVILNGRNIDKETPYLAGRLAYALRFLQSVAEVLQQAADTLASESEPPYPEWRAAVKAWQAVTEQAYRSLHQWQQDLDLDVEEGALGDALRQLIRSVEARAQRLTAARENWLRVIPRRYLTTLRTSEDEAPQDLVAYWLQRYGQPAWHAYARRFYWEMDDQGRWQCYVVLDEKIRLTRENLLEVVDALAEQAFAPARSEFSLKDLLLQAQEGLEEHQPDTWLSLVEPMWQLAKPHLDIDPQQPADQASVLVLPEAFVNTALPEILLRPAQWLPDQLDPTVEGRVFPWSDPWGFILVRLYDSVLLSTLPEVRDKIYPAYLAAREETALQTTEPAARAHVFPAEYWAVEYERRLARRFYLPRDFAFHPLLVLALESPEDVRRFALAWVAGWFAKTPDGRSLVLRLGDQQFRWEGLSGNLPPVLQALLQWRAWGRPEGLGTAPWEALLTQPDEAALNRWRAYYRLWRDGLPADWQRHTPLVQGWEALAAWFVWEHLQSHLH